MIAAVVFGSHDVGVTGHTPARQRAVTEPPLTPGAVALMTADLSPASLERLRLALSDPDPTVRAVSSRAAFVLRLQTLGAAVRAALEREEIEFVAAEHIRALLVLDAGAGRDLAERYLPRAGAAGVRAYLEWLIAHDLSQLPARMEELMRPLEPGEVVALVAALVDQTPVENHEIEARLLRSWLRVSAGNVLAADLHPWRTVLENRSAGRAVDAAILLDALASTDPAVRRETVWWIAGSLARGRAVPDDVLEAALPPPTLEPSPTDRAVAWEMFGREILARARRRSQPLDRSALLKQQAARHVIDAQAALLLGVLTPNERKGLRAVLGARAADPNVARLSGPWEPRIPGMRTPDVLTWPNMLRTLLSASGCRLFWNERLAFRQQRLAMVGVQYAPDGALSRLFFDVSPLAPGCDRAVAALARLTPPDPATVAKDGRQWLVLPVWDHFLRCADEAGGDGPLGWVHRHTDGQAGVASGPATVQPLRKIRHVNPEYPPSAQRDGVRGAVVLDARISERGCVAGAAITRSAGTALDAAALAAVLRWRFAPTLVDGRAVPVLTTITVNFALR